MPKDGEMTFNGLEELMACIQDTVNSVNNIDALSGQTIIKDSKVIAEKIEINESRLSPNDQEALNEAEYLKTLKETGKVGEKDATINRAIRDRLHTESKGDFKELF